jgi:hypothetical protein
LFCGQNHITAESSNASTGYLQSSLESNAAILQGASTNVTAEILQGLGVPSMTGEFYVNFSMAISWSVTGVAVCDPPFRGSAASSSVKIDVNIQESTNGQWVFGNDYVQQVYGFSIACPLVFRYNYANQQPVSVSLMAHFVDTDSYSFPPVFFATRSAAGAGIDDASAVTTMVAPSGASVTYLSSVSYV